PGENIRLTVRFRLKMCISQYRITHYTVRKIRNFLGSPTFFTQMEKSYPQVIHKMWIDRKSTRLNSSHVSISYAVFCSKKKKKPSSVKDSPLVAESSSSAKISIVCSIVELYIDGASTN